MAIIPYTLGGSHVAPLTFSVKKTGDAAERFVSAASGVITFNADKGNYTYNVVVTDALGCTDSESFVLCCQATGGSMSGSTSPAQNAIINFVISGIDGIYSEVGSNGGFFITGGNAFFVTTPSGGIATVNVGTLPFQLCYKLRSCDVERSICANITPQNACVINHSAPVYACWNTGVFSVSFNITGGSGSYEYSDDAGITYSPTSFGFTNNYTAGSHTILIRDQLNPSCSMSVVVENNNVDPCSQIGILYTDCIFSIGSSAMGGAVCTTNTNMINNFQFYLKDTNSFSTSFNQLLEVGTTPTRFIPNGSALASARLLAPPCRSCGNIDSVAFYRFGLDVAKLYADYPTQNVFTYDVYARKDPALNDASYLDFIVRLNKLNNCQFVPSAQANCVDWSRTGLCGSLGFTDYNDSLATPTTTFTKVGTITVNKSANTVGYA